MEYPRRYVRPVVHHAIIIWHPATRPRWGAGTARPLVALSFRAASVWRRFLFSARQAVDCISPMRPGLPRLPRAGRMTHKDGGRPRLRRVPFAVPGGARMRRPLPTEGQARQRDSREGRDAHTPPPTPKHGRRRSAGGASAPAEGGEALARMRRPCYAVSWRGRVPARCRSNQDGRARRAGIVSDNGHLSDGRIAVTKSQPPRAVAGWFSRRWGAAYRGNKKAAHGWAAGIKPRGSRPLYGF